MEFQPLTIETDVIEFDIEEEEVENEGGEGEGEGEEEEGEEEAGEEEEFAGGGGGGGGGPPDPPESEGCLEPHEGMEFDSEEAARIFYNSYARRLGFSIRASTYHRSRRDSSIICRQIVCSRQGFHHSRDRGTKNKHKRPRPIQRVGCKAMIMVKKHDDSGSGSWRISKLIKQHNHPLVPPDKVHRLRSHRHLSGPARTLIHTLQAAGIGPTGVMSVLAKESGGINNLGFTTVDCRNYLSNRNRTLAAAIHLLLDYLIHMNAQNPAFVYAVQPPGNIFWAHPNCTTDYGSFGDTVTFDTTYRTNRYRVPFAPFTGLNHHAHPVLFGCALLLNESEASFLWLFQTWLAVMGGRHPLSITTDQDRVIQSAVAQAFPHTRHRFCKLNILREAQDKLSAIYHSNPTFETEFRNCINTTETIDEFELSWKLLLQKYNLAEHEWLHSMYSVRHQWVPAYLRDTFFGDMSATQGPDNVNSFFDGYVNASTTIQVLAKQYENAVASRHEKEVKADYDTINSAPPLKTPSPMEKQAASIYTRRVFFNFQQQLVETLAMTATKIQDTGTVTTYRVAKFGDDLKAYIVKFHVFEMKADCTCKMFTFSGIICRHILAVFRVTNVLTLPSHYISKRWTRNAKSGVVVDENALELPSNSRELLEDRFNNLRQEAIKYVDEGSKSLLVYNVAMDALKEAAKKVAAAKKQGSGLPQVELLRNGSSQEVCVSEGSRLDSLKFSSEVEKDKKILELMRDLESANQRCEVYRMNLVAVLKDMEEQKLKLSVKVQNVKLSLKD